MPIEPSLIKKLYLVLITRGLIVVKSQNSASMDSSEVKLLFGKRIRELRKSRGWTQEAFALHVDLDRSYVGGIERGERNVSLENISLMAATLDVPISKLFEGWSIHTVSQDSS